MYYIQYYRMWLYMVMHNYVAVFILYPSIKRWKMGVPVPCFRRRPKFWDFQNSETKILRPKFWDQNYETKILRPKFWDQTSETKNQRPKIWDRNSETNILRPTFWDQHSETKILRPKIIKANMPGLKIIKNKSKINQNTWIYSK